jgi:hypothetical protein
VNGYKKINRTRKDTLSADFSFLNLPYSPPMFYVKGTQCLIIILAEKERLPGNKIQSKSGCGGLIASSLTGGVFSVALFTIALQEFFSCIVQLPVQFNRVIQGPPLQQFGLALL